MPALPQTKQDAGPNLFNRTQIGRSLDIVRQTHTDELVIVLCGPIGSPLHLIASKFERILVNQFDYACRILKMSHLIEAQKGAVSLSASRFKRITELISKGNDLRREHGAGVLAELAIGQISLARQERKEKSRTDRFEPSRVCHIIDSIKNQEELHVLRLVYRDMLYCVGVLSPVEFREQNLEREEMKLAEVHELIDRDSGEEFEHGQTVRDTFPQSQGGTFQGLRRLGSPSS